MELPAFQLSMNVFFRFHRNAPGSLELVWRDLLTNHLVCLPARSLGYFYSEPKPETLFPRSETGPKNKKPGAERRAQPPIVSVAPREARQNTSQCS